MTLGHSRPRATAKGLAVRASGRAAIRRPESESPGRLRAAASAGNFSLDLVPTVTLKNASVDLHQTRLERIRDSDRRQSLCRSPGPAQRTGNDGVTRHPAEGVGHGLAMPPPQRRELAIGLTLNAMGPVVRSFRRDARSKATSSVSQLRRDDSLESPIACSIELSPNAGHFDPADRSWPTNLCDYCLNRLR